MAALVKLRRAKGFEKRNLTITSEPEKLAQYWRSRLSDECSEQSETSRESIICWLIGNDSTQFEILNLYEQNIAKQAMEYRYRILAKRYLGQTKERAYRNLITRLGSLVTLRNKIQTWISLSRDRQRSVLDVVQEVLQELLQSDTYVLNQMVFICELTSDRKLQNALLFASVEEYCLRPVRNQPLLVYRFVNYLRQTQRGGLTQVPSSDNVRLVSEEVLTEDNDNPVNLLDYQAVTEYLETQDREDQQALRQEVKQEFENYLLENIGLDAVEWLRLYLQGKSQDAIAKKLNKPINEVYRLREKISYHAVRVFALKGKPELVDSWLSISLRDNNLGLTQNQLGILSEQLTPIQGQILELRKAGEPIEAVAQQLKFKTHQVMGEWTKIFLLAQSLQQCA
ncbi:MAG: HetZ-related protein 2 [Rhizonema sp. PD37]|nr:HetZ-related protein 2 [Rhizonema sp. PD37]